MAVRAFALLGYIEVQGDFINSRLQLMVADAGRIQHPLGCQDGVGLGIFVTEVDDLGDTALNDGFGAFIAGEKGHIDLCAPERLPLGI